jgi:sec-independent protein translocase protein TatB
MFGLGWGEMVVIGIVALIAIGPKELPTVLRSAGQWIGKIRRMAAEFQGQFQEALREAELSDLKKHAEDITSDITKFDPMADTQKEVEKAFEMPDPLRIAESSPTAPALEAPINVPMPSLPPPVTEKDFAPVPAPVAKAPKASEPKTASKTSAKEKPPVKKTKKRAGGGK